MTDAAHRLVERIMKLPPQRIAQVEDFIDFLTLRSQTEGGAQVKSIVIPHVAVAELPQSMREKMGKSLVDVTHVRVTLTLEGEVEAQAQAAEPAIGGVNHGQDPV